MAVRTLNLVLPEETVQAIEAQVASGRFTDASDFVRTSIERLSMDQDQQDYETNPDEWIRQHALPALDALVADPSTGLSVEQVFAALKEDREEHLRKAS